MSLREYVRTPLLLGLLVVLPVYFIGIAVLVLPDGDISIAVPESGIVTVPLPDFIAVLMTPTVGALIGGIVGLFLMQTSKATDQRLIISGFRHSEVIFSRLALIATAGAVVTGVSMVVTLLLFSPEFVWLFAAATFLAALLYGLVGILVGVLFNRLAGIYVMLFGPMIDIVLFQNPLATDSEWWTEYLPGYYLTKVAIDASFASGFEWSNLLGAGGYLGVLVLAASGILYLNTSD